MCFCLSTLFTLCNYCTDTVPPMLPKILGSSIPPPIVAQSWPVLFAGRDLALIVSPNKCRQEFKILSVCFYCFTIILYDIYIAYIIVESISYSFDLYYSCLNCLNYNFMFSRFTVH